MRTMLTIAAALLFSLPVGAGENWPEFHGPGGEGRSSATGLPLVWSASENVVWKAAIHDRGWSSPVVWGDQIWVTTATRDGRTMYAVCVDRRTGAVRHDVTVFETPEPEHIAAVNSYASPTPVIEEGRIYAHYGTYGTACLDTATGRILWTRRDLNCDHHEGPGSSPILFENLLIVNVDGRDVQYVVALDKTTGRTVWKTDRSIDYGPYHQNTRKAFTTPTVIRSGGRVQLISVGARAVWSYDPPTGAELWKIRHRGWSAVARPVVASGLVFFNIDYERPELWAVRPDGAGDVTDSHIAWTITRGMPAQPSIVAVGDLLYTISDRGVAHAIEAATGTTVWKESLGGSYAASIIHADGRLYYFGSKGKTTVLKPGRTYTPLAVNELGEDLMATPAVAGKAFFIRTEGHLYRIESAPKKEP